ncbi:MAG: hypothetical protein IJU70_09410 [Lentisphaeria bacterium]|nr:hypothetical protein [Lentisphaeria bacterium]
MAKLFFAWLLCVPLLLSARVQVFNAGIGGHSTADGVKRIDALLKQYEPSVLVIGYGANDAVNSRALVPEKEFKANFGKMIRLARKSGVRVIVLNTCNPCIDSYIDARHKYPDGLPPSRRIAKYNKAVAEVAARNGIILNDFHAAVMGKGGASGDRASLIRNAANSGVKDGLHLTSEGAKLLAETVARVLEGKVRDNDRILCLGDSITYGAALSGAGTVTGETYPAWLKTLVNFNLGLSTEKQPAPYVKPRPMTIANVSFEDDRPGAMALEWANSAKAGKAEVRAEAGNKFLRISTTGTSFCRTGSIVPQQGDWILRLRARGGGSFSAAVSMTGVKPSFVPLRKEWFVLGGAWKTYEIPFNVPAQVRNLMLVIRTKGGTADFDDFVIVPALGKKDAASASLKGGTSEMKFLHPRQGGGVAGIVKDGKTEFINFEPRRSLWSMTFKKIDISGLRLPEVAPLSIDPERDDNGGGGSDDAAADLKIAALDFSHAETALKADSKTVVMTWKNLDVGGEKGVLDVRVQIKLSGDGKSFVFTASFDNRSKKYTVFYFDYPVIGGLGGINGRPGDDYLATPFFNGRLIRNPVEKGLFRKDRICQPNRSGHSMHMDVLYNGTDGLYLGVHDPEQYIKRWEIASGRKEGVSWTLRNVPNNMREVPQSWKIPYPAVVRTFDGDWYDGCQIYRGWATAQFWCKEGRTSVRKNLPQWFKDIVEWGQYVGKKHDSQEPMMRRFRRDFPQYPLGVFLTYWGRNRDWSFHFGDPDRFPIDDADRTVLKSLKDNQVRIMGYIQCTGWSDGSPSFRRDPELAKKNLVRNYYGQFIKWPYKNPVQDLIAYPGEAWTKALGDNIVKMAETGFDAAYLDSGNHGGTYLNFTPACSSESGGGTGYIRGQHRLLETLRERARRINPGFCFTAESFWEGNIAHLDGYLVCNTTNAYLEGGRVTAIPMVQTVYGDYTMMHGLWPSRHDTERDNALGYVAKNALALCWGVTPGWNIFNLLYTYGNNEIVRTTSKERYAAYAAGKKYFVYGRLLRAPRIVQKAESLRVKWHRSYSASYFDILMDAVIGTVFQAPDGSYALVLYNISEKPVKAEADLKRSLPAGEYDCRTLYPEKLAFEREGGLAVSLEVPARVPVVITLTKKN